ncbi:MAG: preprotein translocase subunit YajC [Lachnospiraceae bacterium]|nr:preprotein translocase subunit YajC [Lachnospiraceae bacterium]
MNFLVASTDAASAGGGSMSFFLIYIVIIGLFFYLMIIRPQNQEKKKREAINNSLEVGDSVLTTAGFYGVIIDITEDTVIVEFGNNKNCRIPMQKSSIVQVEKPMDAAAAASAIIENEKKEKN